MATSRRPASDPAGKLAERLGIDPASVPADRMAAAAALLGAKRPGAGSKQPPVLPQIARAVAGIQSDQPAAEAPPAAPRPWWSTPEGTLFDDQGEIPADQQVPVPPDPLGPPMPATPRGEGTVPPDPAFRTPTPGPDQVFAAGEGPGAPPAQPTVLSTPAGDLSVPPGVQGRVQFDLPVGGGGRGPDLRGVQGILSGPNADLDQSQADYDVAQRMLHTEQQMAQEERADQMAQQSPEVLERQKQEAEAQQVAVSETRNRMSQHEALVQRMSSMRVDPNRFFSTRNGPGMFGAALSLALADVTSGRGATLIQGLIEQDISAQQADLEQGRFQVGASENLLGEMRRIHGDEETARGAARDAMLERFAMEAAQLAARHQGDEIGRRAQVAEAQIREEQAALRATLAQQSMQAYLRSARRGGGQRVRVQLTTPVAGQGGGPRVAASIQERIAAGESAASQLTDVANQLREFETGPFTGTVLGSEQGRTLMDLYHTARLGVLNAMAGLQMTGGEREEVISLMPDLDSITQRTVLSSAELSRRIRRAAQLVTDKARRLARNVGTPSAPLESVAAESAMEDPGAAPPED